MHTVRVYIGKDLPDDQAHRLAESFVDTALASAAMREGHRHKGDWILEWIIEHPPSNEDIIARLSLQAAAHNVDAEFISGQIEITQTPDENWLEKTYEEFKPFSIGPFFIYGSHFTQAVPEEQIGLQIDAATAFGSGEHETTKGCLQAMLDLKGKGACPWNILDMGTGSGILALAAWKLWKSPILAVDNEEEAITVTKRHAEANGVMLGKTTVLACCGNGFNAVEIDQRKPYELILMNILAGPVIEMAPRAVSVLDDNGYIVLSGMLVEQADLVASAYEGEGLTFRRRYDIGEWTTLVFQKL